MFLGVEIGGTKLQIGVGTGLDARFETLRRLPIDASAGAAGILESLQRIIAPLRDQYAVQAIGFGFGGPVDGSQGRVITSHQINGWTDFPLAEWCRTDLGLTAVLGNDCDAAALAEARWGAGRGRRIVLYVTVGTGIGGGLVVDGRIHGTFRPAASEIGHLRPGLQFRSSDQTVESIASGRGIERAARQWLSEESSAEGTTPQHRNAIQDLRDRCDNQPERLTARTIGEAAVDGNVVALDVMEQAVTTLGWAIAQAATLISPEVVIVGGGVSLLPEPLFLTPLKSAIDQYLFAPLQGQIEVLPPTLGEEVVVHGALAFAAQTGDS